VCVRIVRRCSALSSLRNLLYRVREDGLLLYTAPWRWIVVGVRCVALVRWVGKLSNCLVRVLHRMAHLLMHCRRLVYVARRQWW
jgi:hypothetical protein